MTASKKLIQAAAGSAGGGEFYPYTIDNSVRFNSADSAVLYRQNDTAWTSNKIATRSVWIKRTKLGARNLLFYIGNSGGNGNMLTAEFGAASTIKIFFDGAGAYYLETSAVYRDVSAWYHIVITADTTQATASDRCKLWVNGEQVTSFAVAGYPPQNHSWNTTTADFAGIGGVFGSSYPDYYQAESYLIDGTAYDADTFGEFKNGVWIPKNASGGVTFGAQGSYCTFSDSAEFGTDSSGNGNTYTYDTGLTSSDQMIDTPTNNFATWNAVDAYTSTFSDGNLSTTTGNSSNPSLGTMSIPSTGEWYWEVTVDTVAEMSVGVVSTPYAVGNRTIYYRAGGASNSFYIEGSLQTESGASYTNGDVIGVYVNSDSSEISWYKNGSLQGGTAFTLSSLDNLVPLLLQASGAGTCSGTVNFGQSSFAYTPPGSALALCTANLPEPTLGPNSAENVTDYFAPVLYTGNGTAIGSGGKAVTGVGFQPDMVWIKNRDAADNHMVFDDVRGVTKYISTNSTSGETTDTESLSTFDTDGFTLGNNVAVNTSTEDYVAWVLKENSGFFDVVTYTGTAANQTVAHSLDNPPNIVIAKIYQSPTYGSWLVDPDSGGTQYMLLESTAASLSADFGGGNTVWNNTAPTSSVFSLGSNVNANESGKAGIAYLFSNMDGMCKIGSYTGNGSTDGPFVYTGFRPAFILVKVTSTTSSWVLYDTARDSYNVASKYLLPDTSGAEGTNSLFDINSNGFKCRGNPTSTNGSGQTYIYMAFAETPFKYSNAR